MLLEVSVFWWSCPSGALMACVCVCEFMCVHVWVFVHLRVFIRVCLLILDVAAGKESLWRVTE